jgi:gliding motility-associated-like protein/uncharacterized repeat protein (TIGR01451 family)
VNVLANDKLNSVILTPADVVITSTKTGPLTVNTNGTVSVDPNTPAGTYTAQYTICEVLNPNNCDTATVTVTVYQDLPSINVLKDGTYVDTDNNGKTNPGDTVTYTFVVTNTGNVDLTKITLADNNATVVGGPIALLRPNEKDSNTFTATHVITQSDIDTGYVYNTAIVSGTTPTDVIVNGISSDPTPCTTCPIIPTCTTCTITELAQNPSMVIVKTSTTENYSNVGDVLNYTIKITNNGNVTLNQIVVTDPLTGLDSTLDKLEPGMSREYVQNYSVTQNDINNLSVTNIAYVKASTPKNQEISASDDAVVEAAIVLPCGNIVVHNAFSPNGDGINEVFTIDSITDTTCYPTNTVEIYNRWGVLVYEVKDYDNVNRAFKGFSEGRVTINQSVGLPVGTYFYILNYTSVDGNGASVTNKKSGYLYLTR